MKKTAIVLAAFLGTLVAVVIFLLASRTSDLRGRVLVHGSAAPVVGATVTLNCQQSTLHGYRTLRTITTTTAADGGYLFAAAEVSNCDHVDVRAVALGYMDAWDERLKHALIDRRTASGPKRIWLIDERDAMRLNLEGRFAKTAEDFDRIRENYCDRVKQHWVQTPEQSQTKLLQAGDVGDYENDVVRFCAETGIPEPVALETP
jgi:hypothetical protein